jgi:hypothetical protein
VDDSPRIGNPAVKMTTFLFFAMNTTRHSTRRLLPRAARRTNRSPLRGAASALVALALIASTASHALCPFAASTQGYVGASAAADGALLLRYAMGANIGSDAALLAFVNRAGVSPGNPVAMATAATAIRGFINLNKTALDIDGDSQFTVIDAHIIARYLVGFRGDALKTDIATTAGATRTNGEALQRFVDDGCTMDASLAAWNGFNLALIAGDAPRAKQFLTATALENFGAAIDTLLPQMASIVGSFSAPVATERTEEIVQYVLSRPNPGIGSNARALYAIILVRAPDGGWLIDSF